MERRWALSILAALALAAYFVSWTLPARGAAPQQGTIVTVAGTGAAGFSGDNGPATQAQLNWPAGLALDAAGNLYIADTLNQRVRKVSPDGTITTVVGNGQPGFSGDGGPATEARLSPGGRWGGPGLAVDGAGNLFIADWLNNRVRKVTPEGIISTYVGNGSWAVLSVPIALAVDAAGNLFIADAFNFRVVKVSPDRVITTVAGNGTPMSSGDRGPATKAGMAPVALAVDASGDLFIADCGVFLGIDSNRVRKVTPDGIITTVAGSTGGFSGDGGPATKAKLFGPWGLAVDSQGNLFVNDWGSNRVRRIDAVTGVITTVAGNGNTSYTRDGGLATKTGLQPEEGLAIDAAGNLFLVNTGYPGINTRNERVLEVYGVAAPGLLAGKPFPGAAVSGTGVQ
jgi:sugar lactone lactonase YvrE